MDSSFELDKSDFSILCSPKRSGVEDVNPVVVGPVEAVDCAVVDPAVVAVVVGVEQEQGVYFQMLKFLISASAGSYSVI